MKLKPLFILTVCTLLLASCDKIDENNYILFSGAEGEWVDGQGVSDHSQRALIEKYTGVRCVNCPTADQAINDALTQYGSQLIAVAIHDSCLAFTRPIGDSPDLRTPDGDAWSKAFGIYNGSYPNGMVSRKPTASGFDLFTPTSGINDRVNEVIDNEANIAIQCSAALADGTINIDVNLEFLSAISQPLTLTLFIMEDGINATQRMPDGTDNEDYIHNHVLRDVITDIWGADIDCTGTAGEKRFARFAYAQYKEEWDLQHCHIVAFVSDKGSKQILNVAECEVE